MYRLHQPDKERRGQRQFQTDEIQAHPKQFLP
jgi:hypothetical protein